MKIEVLKPFSQMYKPAFRKGEVVTMPDAEAKSLIDGGLAKPVLGDGKSPEFATALPQRKK